MATRSIGERRWAGMVTTLGKYQGRVAPRRDGTACSLGCQSGEWCLAVAFRLYSRRRSLMRMYDQWPSEHAYDHRRKWSRAKSHLTRTFRVTLVAIARAWDCFCLTAVVILKGGSWGTFTRRSTW